MVKKQSRPQTPVKYVGRRRESYQWNSGLQRKILSFSCHKRVVQHFYKLKQSDWLLSYCLNASPNLHYQSRFSHSFSISSSYRLFAILFSIRTTDNFTIMWSSRTTFAEADLPVKQEINLISGYQGSFVYLYCEILETMYTWLMLGAGLFIWGLEKLAAIKSLNDLILEH